MAFAVDQGCKPSVIGCFFSEHDPTNKTFRNSSWISGKPSIDNDAPMQGIECGLQLASDSSNVPHWMNSEQVLSLQGNSGGDKTPDVAPCTPVPSFSRPKVQKCEMSATNSDYPSLCLSIGSPGKRAYQSIQLQSATEQRSPRKVPCQRITVNSPRSLSSKYSQKECFPSVDSSKEELLSLLLYKHPKCGEASTTLRSQRSSPLSFKTDAIPYLENFTSDEMQSSTSVGQTDVDHHKLLLETNYRSLNSSACKMANEGSLSRLFPGSSQGLVGTSSPKTAMVSTPVLKKGTLENSSPLNAKSVLLNASVADSQTTQVSQDMSCFSKASPYKRFSEGLPSLTKEGRESKPHMLSDFFVQAEMNLSPSSESRVHPEKKCRLFTSHDSLYQRSSIENGSPRNGILGSVKEIKSNQQKIESINLHRTNSNSPKVKIEFQFNETGSKNFSTLQLPINTSVLNCGNVVVSTNEGALSNLHCISSNVVDTLNSSTPNRAYNYGSTTGLLQRAYQGYPELAQEASSVFRNLSSDKDSKNSSVNGDWGKFLALSAVPEQHSTEHKSDIILPFQLRFQKLQEFLKKCDESDQKYCLEAVKCLTALERNDRAMELETRAVKLSLEEGKELSRMKSLNILCKRTEAPYLAANLATPNGPKLPAPGIIVQVKQESHI